MNQAQIEQREKELRVKYPGSFSRPGIRQGEMFVVASVATFQLPLLLAAGFKSARTCLSPEDVTFTAISRDRKGGESKIQIRCSDYFVNVREFIEVEAAKEEARQVRAWLPAWLARVFQ